MDDRSDSAARDDGATFAPARVRGSRGPRIVAAVVVIAVGAMIAMGALNQQPTEDTLALAPGGSAVFATDGFATVIATAVASRPPRPTSDPRATEESVPRGDVIDLDVRPAGSHLFIHGDVFSLAVSRIRVKLEDAAGHVAATRAVDLPGGSTAFLIGAVPRFDLHFFLPDEVQADGFVVSATALDATGHRLATVEQRIPRAPASM